MSQTPSPRLPHLESRGARLVARPEAPELASPLTFGDVPGEYAAGATGALLFDTGDRGRIRVGGSEAADFLHRITANDIRGLAPGTANTGLLLTPKGKIRHAFDALRTADGVELVSAPGQAADLAQALDMFLFTEDVTLDDVSDEHAPLELVGPRAGEVIAAALGQVELPDEPGHVLHAEFEGRTVEIRSQRVAGSLGFALDAGVERATRLWDALAAAGATEGGVFARDSLRAEAGAALFGIDVDDNVYPQEARWEHAFSLVKGCYTGQEVVAKIDTYGGMNKCLVVLAIDGDDPVPRGAELVRVDEADERSVGLVTTWSYSFALDRGIALAYAKRKHQAIGTRFRLGADGPTATIVEFPVREGALAPTGPMETA